MAILFAVGYYTEGRSIGSFFFAILLGALGASIALMQTILKEGKTAHYAGTSRYFRAIIPTFYGMLLSGFAFLLFMSGILTGDGGGGLFTTNLFPNFSDDFSLEASLFDQFRQIEPANIQDTGKLLVWCFLAGYSEKFVLGIIGQLERKGG